MGWVCGGVTAVNGASVNDGPAQEMYISLCLLEVPMSGMEIQSRAASLNLLLFFPDQSLEDIVGLYTNKYYCFKIMQ